MPNYINPTMSKDNQIIPGKCEMERRSQFLRDYYQEPKIEKRNAFGKPKSRSKETSLRRFYCCNSNFVDDFPSAKTSDSSQHFVLLPNDNMKNSQQQIYNKDSMLLTEVKPYTIPYSTPFSASNNQGDCSSVPCNISPCRKCDANLDASSSNFNKRVINSEVRYKPKLSSSQYHENEAYDKQLPYSAKQDYHNLNNTYENSSAYQQDYNADSNTEINQHENVAYLAPKYNQQQQNVNANIPTAHYTPKYDHQYYDFYNSAEENYEKQPTYFIPQNCYFGKESFQQNNVCNNESCKQEQPTYSNSQDHKQLYLSADDYNQAFYFPEKICPYTEYAAACRMDNSFQNHPVTMPHKFYGIPNYDLFNTIGPPPQYPSHDLQSCKFLNNQHATSMLHYKDQFMNNPNYKPYNMPMCCRVSCCEAKNHSSSYSELPTYYKSYNEDNEDNPTQFCCFSFDSCFKRNSDTQKIKDENKKNELKNDLKENKCNCWVKKKPEEVSETVLNKTKTKPLSKLKFRPIGDICNFSCWESPKKEKPHISVKFRILQNNKSKTALLNKTKKSLVEQPKSKLNDCEDKIHFKVYQVVNKKDVDPKRLVAYVTKNLPTPLPNLDLASNENQFEKFEENEELIKNLGSDESSEIEKLNDTTNPSSSWFCCFPMSNDDVQVNAENDNYDCEIEPSSELKPESQNESNYREKEDLKFLPYYYHDFRRNPTFHPVQQDHNNFLNSPLIYKNISDPFSSSNHLEQPNPSLSCPPYQQESHNINGFASTEQQFFNTMPSSHSHPTIYKGETCNCRQNLSSFPLQTASQPLLKDSEPCYPNFSYLNNELLISPSDQANNIPYYENQGDNYQYSYEQEQPKERAFSSFCCHKNCCRQLSSNKTVYNAEESIEEKTLSSKKQHEKIVNESKNQVNITSKSFQTPQNTDMSLDKNSEIENTVQPHIIYADRNMKKTSSCCCRRQLTDSSSVISEETIIFTKPTNYSNKNLKAQIKPQILQKAAEPIGATVQIKNIPIKPSFSNSIQKKCETNEDNFDFTKQYTFAHQPQIKHHNFKMRIFNRVIEKNEPPAIATQPVCDDTTAKLFTNELTDQLKDNKNLYNSDTYILKQETPSLPARSMNCSETIYYAPTASHKLYPRTHTVDSTNGLPHNTCFNCFETKKQANYNSHNTPFVDGLSVSGHHLTPYLSGEFTCNAVVSNSDDNQR